MPVTTASPQAISQWAMWDRSSLTPGSGWPVALASTLAANRLKTVPMKQRPNR